MPTVSREPVLVGDLQKTLDRWPLFAPGAASSGFVPVHALPLRRHTDVIGALNLFGSTAGTPAAADVQVVQALADVATIGLLQERAIRRAEVLAEQLQGALNSRVVIEQAQGVLSRVHGTSVDKAFERLRDYSRTSGHKLGEVAHAVITEPATVPGLIGPHPGSTAAGS